MSNLLARILFRRCVLQADASTKLDNCESLRESLLPQRDSGTEYDTDDEDNRFAHRKIEVDVPLKQGDVFVPPGGGMSSGDASPPPSSSQQSPAVSAAEANPGDLAQKHLKPKRKRVRKQCRCTHPGCGALIRGSSNLLAHMRVRWNAALRRVTEARKLLSCIYPQDQYSSFPARCGQRLL